MTYREKAEKLIAWSGPPDRFPCIAGEWACNDCPSEKAIRTIYCLDEARQWLEDHKGEKNE